MVVQKKRLFLIFTGWQCLGGFCTPVPLANVGDGLAHGNLAIRGAFKIADHFTGWHQPFKPLLGDGVLNVTGSV